MNKSMLRLYKAAVESPEQGLSTIKLKLCRMREIDWTHFSRLISYPRLPSPAVEAVPDHQRLSSVAICLPSAPCVTWH